MMYIVYPEGVFLKQCMGARNREGIWLLYRPARLNRSAESVPWNLFLGSLKVKKFGLCTVKSRAGCFSRDWQASKVRKVLTESADSCTV